MTVSCKMTSNARRAVTASKLELSPAIGPRYGCAATLATTLGTRSWIRPIPERADDGDFQLPAGAGGGAAAADSGRARLAGLVQGLAAEVVQRRSLGEDSQTIKRCPPFIDAMTYGFLIPLATDLKVENGEFSWDWTMRGGEITIYSRSPIDFHDRARSPARRSSTTTALSSSSTISGRSSRRPAIRCCSRIRSTAPTCRSPPSPAWSTATGISDSL